MATRYTLAARSHAAQGYEPQVETHGYYSGVPVDGFGLVMLRLVKVQPDVEPCLSSVLARSPPKWTALPAAPCRAFHPHGLEEIMYARKPVKSSHGTSQGPGAVQYHVTPRWAKGRLAACMRTLSE